MCNSTFLSLLFQALDLSRNELKALPPSLGDLTCLSALRLNNNPFLQLPKVRRFLTLLLAVIRCAKDRCRHDGTPAHWCSIRCRDLSIKIIGFSLYVMKFGRKHHA